jgi:cell pole-organizing protein PopZ
VVPETASETTKDEPQPAAATPSEPVSEVQPLYAVRETPQPSTLAEMSAEPSLDEIQATLDEALPKAGAPIEEIEPAAPVPQPAAETQVQPVARPAILSEQAGRQVAAAFGELSEVFAASRRKSFDELAEEMLRPMLQDWLDNNLPTLVERLVREEIERVARGG